MASSGCYVYAIQPRSPGLPSGLRGLWGTPVSTVCHRDLAAVIGDCRRNDLRPTADLVLRHESVVEALRRHAPGLPVRFGTVLASDQAVARALAERHDVLTADLERLGDKVELGLTVLWDDPGGGAGAVGGDHGLTGGSPGSGSPGPGARYLQALLAASRREEAELSAAEAVARQLDRTLGAYAIERRCGLPRARRMVTRSTYLLQPSQVPRFQGAFEALRGEHRGLRFLLSGPWPPYSFVTPADAGSPSPLMRCFDQIGRLVAHEAPGTRRASG